jgi:hypothetical protein
MRVDYLKNDTQVAKSAELFCLGNSLVIQEGTRQHRVVLSQGQWKLLADGATQRASGEDY